MKIQLVTVLALLSGGCLLDSVEPWLSPATIIETGIDVAGDWSLVSAVELFGSGAESVITIKRKPTSARRKEFFYIKIRPTTRDTQFVFEATLHEVEGLRFLQVSNFTHWDDKFYSLANRPTYSLWRVEADADNIVIWMPELPQLTDGGLKTLRDQNDKVLFVDRLENNEAAVRAWAHAERSKTDRPRGFMSLTLTRVGTEFEIPAVARPFLPRSREAEKRDQEGGSE